MSKVVIIIQARMTSTRLPGKVLLPVLGRPMFSFQIERLKKVRGANQIIVATTVNSTDDPIVAFCADESLDHVRGSEHDVLSRYVLAAHKSSADVVVRVTSDCPLLDPELVDKMILEYFGDARPDYVSNMLVPTWPYGMAVEVFSAAALFEAEAEPSDPVEREHVTPFIYRHPERYRLHSVTRQVDLSDHRWTVDTPEDFELITRILTELYPGNPDFHMDDVLKLLDRNPDWVKINQHIQQKKI
jgi:spore coat polysaccharide biosynthesis protein SpsF